MEDDAAGGEGIPWEINTERLFLVVDPKNVAGIGPEPQGRRNEDTLPKN